MNAIAVVLEEPERLVLKGIALPAPGADDVVVDIDWSGISTGTERLLWSGRMPPFPGLGYPLVPGYESVGRIREAGANQSHRVGETVFVPGATCFGAIRGLFGGAASRVVVPSARALPIGDGLGECGTLLALAATAYHAAIAPDGRVPELIVGHGVLGRLLARVVMALGHAAPTVWEMNPKRMDGAEGYQVVAPSDDPRRNYSSIVDVSGDSAILDTLIQRLAPQGEIVLAGFYSEGLTFTFPRPSCGKPAFVSPRNGGGTTSPPHARSSRPGSCLSTASLRTGTAHTTRRSPIAQPSLTPSASR